MFIKVITHQFENGTVYDLVNTLHIKFIQKHGEGSKITYTDGEQILIFNPLEDVAIRLGIETDNSIEVDHE